MLSLIVFLPLLVAVVLAAAKGLPDAAARWAWLGLSLLELVLIALAWAVYDTPPDGELALEEQVAWIPGVGTSYHVGVDGLSLPLVALTAVVFAACAVHALHEQRRPRSQAALFCFLQTTCLGLFVAADLIVFFVFFDLSIVAMYFVIAGWGHGSAQRSALMFFLYTFLGSLALLLGFIGLYVSSNPRTFDMVELAANPPLAGSAGASTTGQLVLAAVLVGLLVKTPTVPFHSWLPPAHTDAPAIGSAVLAGVLLKMGTYGLVRIAMPMLPDAWRALAWVVLAIGIASVLWGALVALAQTDLKRMIAYTSVNHMGYVAVAVGAAGLVGGSDEQARQLAVTGAVTQMVSHGLITAALFLLAGSLYQRAGTYDLGAYGGLAGVAPRYAVLFSVGAFASLGLPGFSGFVAELQIFTGSIASTAVSAVALLGILLTAVLFLRALQRLLTGPTRGSSVGVTDLRPVELVSVGGLLLLATLLGVLPRPVLEVIEPAAAAVVAMVGS